LDVAFVPNRRHEQTLVWLAGDDRRTGDSAHEERLARVHPQVVFLLACSMTFLAVIHQDWPHFALEIFERLARVLSAGDP